MNFFERKILDIFARREGYDKKPFKNWKEYKSQMLAAYRTGLGDARENPIPLKDLEELAFIASIEMQKKIGIKK